MAVGRKEKPSARQLLQKAATEVRTKRANRPIWRTNPTYVESIKQRYARESNPRTLSRTTSNPGSNRRPLLSQSSLNRRATLGRNTARNQTTPTNLRQGSNGFKNPLFEKPSLWKKAQQVIAKRKAYNSNALFGKSSMAQNTPLRNFTNYPVQSEVNDTQRTLRSNLKILKRDVAYALQLHDQWQSEADPTGDKKAKYIKPLSAIYAKGLRSLVQTTNKVYNARSMMSKAPQVTVFDYDDNYHILSVNLLRVLSLWYSTLSFIKDDTYAISKELRPLISNVHTLFVLATSKNYFGNCCYVSPEPQKRLEK